MNHFQAIIASVDRLANDLQREANCAPPELQIAFKSSIEGLAKVSSEVEQIEDSVREAREIVRDLRRTIRALQATETEVRHA